MARSVGARLIVDAAHVIGLVAGGVHLNPVPVADVVTFSTHKTLRGPRGGGIICKRELAARVDAAVFPMVQGGPNVAAIAAKAVAFGEAAAPTFDEYARRAVSLAQNLAGSFSDNGLRVVTGGTDTHIVLVDLSDIGIDGERAENVLAECGVMANRSRIPFAQSHTAYAGLRFGTAAVATLGMTTEEIAALANAIIAVLRDPDATEPSQRAAALVAELCGSRAAYSGSPQGASVERGVVGG